MEEQFYTILTSIGKAKIANSNVLGSKLNLTKFIVGDSSGSYYNPTEEQTELKNKVWEGSINSINIDKNNPNWIVIETVIPSDIGGFTIREAGILDNENNLIAVAKYPETYKPLLKNGSSKDIILRVILEISNASNVTLKIDPSVTIATKQDILEINKKFDETLKNNESIKDINCLKSTMQRLVNSITQYSFYVDNKNGSDENGDGSKTKPYKTINKVLSLIGTFSNNSVDIILLNDYILNKSIITNNIFFDSMTRFCIKSDDNSKFTIKSSSDKSEFFALCDLQRLTIKNVEFDNVDIHIMGCNDFIVENCSFISKGIRINNSNGIVTGVFKNTIEQCVYVGDTSQVLISDCTGNGSVGVESCKGAIAIIYNSNLIGSVSNTKKYLGGVIL